MYINGDKLGLMALETGPGVGSVEIYIEVTTCLACGALVMSDKMDLHQTVMHFTIATATAEEE